MTISDVPTQTLPAEGEIGLIDVRLHLVTYRDQRKS